LTIPDGMEEPEMKKLTSILSALVFGIGCSTGFAQDHSQHQQGAATDHMAHLDADLEEIRKTTDTAKRKEMLQHHLQMMRENIEAITAMGHGGGGMQGMDHSGKGEGGGGMQGMDHSGKGEGGGGMQGMDHSGKGEGGGGMQGMDHSGKGEGGGGMQGMDHSGKGEGGGGMMQHHDKMVKVLQHMLETQEMILGLMDKK